MKLRISFLGSRLGRRIFGLFICCSLIPIAALSVLSFVQVMNSLESQTSRRLQQSTKAVGVSILERMLLLESELRHLEFQFQKGAEAYPSLDRDAHDTVMASRFKSVVFLGADSEIKPLWGAPDKDLPQGIGQSATSGSEKARVVVQGSDTGPSRIFMVRRLDSRSPKPGLLVGEVSTEYLWSVGPENTLPPMTDICVLDQNNRRIINSVSNPSPLLERLAAARDGSGTRQFEWVQAGESYIACYWTLFMQSRFDSPNWTVVLSISKADVLAPLDDFTVIFPLVTLLSLLVVTYLSMVYIRQTLVPLETLKNGIHQISNREFGTHIVVKSGDEFEDVAATFNEMSAQLGKQFKALTTMSAIDRAILSSLDTERIISTVLAGMRGFFKCEMISIALLDAENPHSAVSYSTNGDIGQQGVATTVSFNTDTLKQCFENRELMLVRRQDKLPTHLYAFREMRVRTWLVLPVFVKDRLAATINMGYRLDTLPQDDLSHARQLADQMAVALSNSSLIEELDELNWGTLKALARTVDAKSPWTGGHSERVCRLSLLIGNTLGLPPHVMDDLHRGAFLHDIGKVGVPNDILDKAGRLSVQEYELIKSHPAIGARILEPISAYKRVIPIVSQHHERFDGKGYPYRIGGTSINLGARILAVADVFDAMLANRPYRNGLAMEEVISHIRGGEGHHFDPLIVDAFLTTVTQQEIIEEIFFDDPLRQVGCSQGHPR